MPNKLKILNLEGFLEPLKGVVQVIKVNLGLKIELKLKKKQGVRRLNWRKEVVLKLENLHMLLVERGTMGNAQGVPEFLWLW